MLAPSEGPVVIAPSTKQETQESRILAALGLLRGPLPKVATKWLNCYYEYLLAHLRLPFEARCPEGSGVLRPWTSNVTVVALVAPSDHTVQDEMGLACEALRGGEAAEVALVDLEVEIDHPNSQLVEDYWYWFWNWQFDPKI